MDLIKETKTTPSLVNPKNFKPKKQKLVPVEIAFKQNSRNLNIILLIGFVIFFGLFLLFCKYSKQNESVEPYSIVYNFNV